MMLFENISFVIAGLFLYLTLSASKRLKRNININEIHKLGVSLVMREPKIADLKYGVIVVLMPTSFLMPETLGYLDMSDSLIREAELLKWLLMVGTLIYAYVETLKIEDRSKSAIGVLTKLLDRGVALEQAVEGANAVYPDVDVFKIGDDK